jgi:hypothetical protein
MNITAIVATILKGADSRHVVVTPMVWHPAKNGGRDWSFTVSVSKQGQWFSVSIRDDDYQPKAAPDPAFLALFDTVLSIRPISGRDLIVAELAARDLVLHLFGDELDAARQCEHLWPSERITRIREPSRPIAGKNRLRH